MKTDSSTKAENISAILGNILSFFAAGRTRDDPHEMVDRLKSPDSDEVEERIAIMTIDGGMTDTEAYRAALDQFQCRGEQLQ